FGGGSVVMGNDANNRILGVKPGDTLTNNDNTISGAGQISNLVLHNNSTINATGSAKIAVGPSVATIINNGTMKASGSGELVISGAFVDNSDGLVQADSAKVTVLSSTVSGGDVATVGTGIITLTTGDLIGGLVTNSATGLIRTGAGTSSLGGSIIADQPTSLVIDPSTSAVINIGTMEGTSGGVLALSSGFFEQHPGGPAAPTGPDGPKTPAFQGATIAENNGSVTIIQATEH